ncbi:Signal transduction histidine kinase [Roseateles sp. YR242]|uniref:sensor histidine kinase n=1 Tax=Roseateles sp. YR242 TaxID=1855305 RepID=UPI0008C4A6E8|nr:sensor histidine kinase [Roseateles sp. YR242]SEL78786.1 Signal transduction histidine kinase [Roseateles sp. YR242]
MSPQVPRHSSLAGLLLRLAGQRLLPVLALLLLGGAASSAAAGALADYEHTVWSEKDGLAAGVVSITQVPNGMLRLRTALGNQIFDGVEFHSPQRNPSGGPFVDYAEVLGQTSPTGAVYYIHPETLRLMRRWKGQTEAVHDKDGLSQWARFIFDQDGVGWYYAVGGLFRLEGLKVEALGDAWGIPKGTMSSNRPVVDAQGTVWIAATDTLFRLARGARKFERYDAAHCAQIAFAPDGALWCASAEGLAVVSMKDGRPAGQRLLTQASYGALFFDSRGGFWICSAGGIEHAADWRSILEPGGIAALQADAMTPKQGLGSIDINTINEDAEGNIWLGTEAGLERFRTTRFNRAPLPEYSYDARIKPDTDGSLWIGPWDRNLMHLSAGRVTDLPRIRRVTAIRDGADGRIWLATDRTLWRKDPGAAFAPVDMPDVSWRERIQQIAEDDVGTVWLQAGQELLQLKEGRLEQPDESQIPHSKDPYPLVADEKRQLWFATNGRGPFVLKGGVFREIKSQAYLDTIIEAWSAHAHGPRVWIGGRGGVGVFEGEYFRPLKFKDDRVKGVTGIVETAQGELWLHGLTKVFRLSAEQLNAGLNGQTLTPEAFDHRDGLRGTGVPSAYAPSLAEDASGRLWVTTNEGLFWIDTRMKPVATLPPVALIRAVKSDGVAQPGEGGVQLSANPGQVEFNYTAAALSIGDRVHFRYRMEGIDPEWRDADTRRTAYYTQLPPGHHRFEVVASNEQGEWAQTPTFLAVEILPAWYQTLWFRALTMALVIGCLWWIYRLRVSVLRARERVRMQEIAGERERIARDLHDTLLQSMQGLILSFQSVASNMPAQGGTRGVIEGQLDRADQLLGEARDRVRDLRGTDADAISLREAFESAVRQLVGMARIELVEDGVPRPLRPLARDRIYLIGREALLNAVMHGEGGDVRVQLLFERRRFVLRVRDKGPGIEHEVLVAGTRPGHYGLVGMRERAAQIGGTVTISRLPEGGTEVELQVPAARAFAGNARGGVWRKLRPA